MQSNWAAAYSRKQQLDLQRIAILTAISVVSRRLAGRLAKMESNGNARKGGYPYDARPSVKPRQ